VLPGAAIAVALVLALTVWATRAGGSSTAALSLATTPSASVSAPAADLVSAGARPRAQPARSPAGLWPTGVHGANQSETDAFAGFRGRANDVAVLFADNATNWQLITSPWIGDQPAHFSNFPGTWVVSEPMFPRPADGQATVAYTERNLTDCAAGNFDTYFRKIGDWLNSERRSDSFVRIGWEANGNWFGWQAVDHVAWKQCFRNEALALLSRDPKARIDWTINAGSVVPDPADRNPFDLYPGDDVVDVIGVDTYDQFPPSLDPDSFNQQCHRPAPMPGLCTVIEFAQLHHKLFSVGEWGVVGVGAGAWKSGNAGGDNPVYIDQMYQTFQRYSYMLAYESYFNDHQDGNVHSSLTNPDLNPRSAAEYQKLWGRSS
jgi:hypothetical protein